jgi:fatty acid amide hydrolase
MLVKERSPEPNKGLVAGIPGQEAIRSQCGPMARTVDDITMLLRALDPAKLSAADGRVPPLPVVDPSAVSLKGLRVGLVEHDGILAPSRANVRAVRRAGEALERAGVEVIPFVIPGVPDAIREYFSSISADGAVTAQRSLGDAPIDVTLHSLFVASKLPGPARRAAGKALRLAGQPLTALVLESLGARSVAEYWSLVTAVRARRFAIEHALDEQGLSGLILPPFATAAVPHTFGAQFAQAASYTMLFNLLQLPAGVIPVTTVRADECDREPSLDAVVRRAREVDRQSLGLPVGVQVVARAWRDDVCLSLMAEIERAVADDAERPSAVVDP